MKPADQKELLRLLELDYEKTTKFIEGVVGSGVTIRGWTITVTIALMAAAFERRLWELGLLAGILVVLFGLADAYHGWLYAEVLEHSANIEHVLGLYYARLARGADDPEAVDDFVVALEAHSFGRFAELTQFRPRALLKARPRVVLVIIYGTLLLIAVAVTVFVVRMDQSARPMVCTPVANAPTLYTCSPK